MKRRPSSLPADGRGVASIEFVLVLPVLLLCLMGVVEITQLYRAQLKTYGATNMLSKMVAQQPSVNKAQMQNLCHGVQMSLAPLSSASYAAAIASVTNRSGTPTMDWEYDGACNSTAQAIGASQAVALGTPQVPQPGNSVIIVTGSYPYTSPFRFFMTNTVLGFTLQSIPRSNAAIACSDC